VGPEPAVPPVYLTILRAGRGFPLALARTTLQAARTGRSPSVIAWVGVTQLATVWGYATTSR